MRRHPLRMRRLHLILKAQIKQPFTHTKSPLQQLHGHPMARDPDTSVPMTTFRQFSSGLLAPFGICTAVHKGGKVYGWDGGRDV